MLRLTAILTEATSKEVKPAIAFLTSDTPCLGTETDTFVATKLCVTTPSENLKAGLYPSKITRLTENESIIVADCFVE